MRALQRGRAGGRHAAQVGALDAERLREFVRQYEQFDDPVIPKFHYGAVPPLRLSPGGSVSPGSVAASHAVSRLVH